MLWKQVSVGRGERALIIKGGEFHSILMPGDHHVFCWPGVSFRVERHNLRDIVFHSKWANHVVKRRPDLVALHFEVIETNSVQVGIVYVSGQLFAVLPPDRRMVFWRGQADIKAELVAVVADTEIESQFIDDLELAASGKRR